MPTTRLMVDLHDPLSPGVAWLLQFLTDKVEQKYQLGPESTSFVPLKYFSRIAPSLRLTLMSFDGSLVCW